MGKPPTGSRPPGKSASPASLCLVDTVRVDKGSSIDCFLDRDMITRIILCTLEGEERREYLLEYARGVGEEGLIFLHDG